jgi:Cu(I)/Ag(I) efflux system periplasmic protein CusF
MKIIHAFIPALALAVATLAAQAQTPAAPAQTDAMKTSSGPDASMADGEVRKIDKDAGKLTIKHGEIKSLDMPPMTMVFQIKDKAMLDSVKAGDKIRFKAVNEGGKMLVTELQPVR